MRATLNDTLEEIKNVSKSPKCFQREETSKHLFDIWLFLLGGKLLILGDTTGIQY